MNKMLKMFIVSLISSSMLVGCDMVEESHSNNNSSEKEIEYPIKLETTYNGKEVDLSIRAVRNYIRFKDEDDRLAETLSEQLAKNQSERTFGDFQNISFSWADTNEDETFTLHFASDKDFKNELFTYETTKNSVDEFGIFVPGETYYYKVEGSITGESKVDSFKAKDSPARFISSGAVLNMRDIGGWTTKDGYKVKYGMLYRGGALDGSEHPTGANYILERGTSRLDDLGLKVFNDYLKIKSEIDLRGVAEDQHDTPTFGGNKKNMCQYANAAVSAVWNKPEDETLKAAIKTYFDFLADETNYPIYFHCNGGADRTGALAYLINGLLGVEYIDLAIDYELTSFSFAAGGIRKRSDIVVDKDGNYSFAAPTDKDPAIGYCRKIMLQNYGNGGEDLQLAIENYLTNSCKISKESIEKIKDIMLEKGE